MKHSWVTARFGVFSGALRVSTATFRVKFITIRNVEKFISIKLWHSSRSAPPRSNLLNSWANIRITSLIIICVIRESITTLDQQFQLTTANWKHFTWIGMNFRSSSDVEKEKKIILQIHFFGVGGNPNNFACERTLKTIWRNIPLISSSAFIFITSRVSDSHGSDGIRFSLIFDSFGSPASSFNAAIENFSKELIKKGAPGVGRRMFYIVHWTFHLKANRRRNPTDWKNMIWSLANECYCFSFARSFFHWMDRAILSQARWEKSLLWKNAKNNLKVLCKLED